MQKYARDSASGLWLIYHPRLDGRPICGGWTALAAIGSRLWGTLTLGPTVGG
jgi:hypothetical protein